MKKFVLFTMLLGFGFCFAQKPVKAKIEKVTVFPSGALIEKSVQVGLKSGDNEFIFQANSPYLLSNSLQFEASDAFIITDLTFVEGFRESGGSFKQTLPEKERSYYTALCDTIERLQALLQQAGAKKTVLQREAAALAAMKPISQPQSVDSVPKFKAAFDFYEQKMQEITKSEIANDKEIRQYSEELKRNERLLSNFHIRYPENKTSNGEKELWVKANIYCEKDVAATTLRYSYLCNNAYWFPIYDIKLSSDKDAIRFVLKANFYQNTGEDWNDVVLTFSSEGTNDNPFLAELSPYRLFNNAVVPQAAPRQLRMAKSNAVAEMNTADAEGIAEEDMAVADVVLASNYTAMTVGTNTLFGKEYTLGRRHSVRSEAAMKTVPLKTDDSKVDYKYMVKPKISPKAYLQALVANWQELEPVDAEANVYFDNKYTSTSSVNPSFTQSDTMRLQLGTDKRISVSRKVNRTTPSKASLLSKEMETMVEINLQIKNNNLKDVDLTIEDQIPISSDGEIKIQTVDLQGAEHEPLTGKLSWKRTLKAGENLNLKVKYSVRYPKGYNLNLN